MLSPLALLQEGEVAEIINPAGRSPCTQPHRHRHGRSDCRCPTQCAGCPCSHTHRGSAAIHSHAHLHDMGIRPGKKVEMVTNSATGPLVLKVDESRIALGRGAAMRIYVRRNEG